MRINKFISETGICSRREADQWIDKGRITINGVKAVLGSKVEKGDVVCLDGLPLGSKPKPIYIALNKPVGITCTTETHIRGNIVDFIGHRERIFPIGRLDKDSEGLILLTNDGDIVNEILRVENAHEKEYIVVVDKPVTDSFLKGMASGVRIMGELTKRCKTERISADSFRIVLTQGLNRQIRRMCAAFDYKVRHLRRVRIMHIELGDLKKGQWRNLTEKEIATLTR
jgi:23S rRNA pseudouridine2604 synthase